MEPPRAGAMVSGDGPQRGGAEQAAIRTDKHGLRSRGRRVDLGLSGGPQRSWDSYTLSGDKHSAIQQRGGGVVGFRLQQVPRGRSEAGSWIVLFDQGALDKANIRRKVEETGIDSACDDDLSTDCLGDVTLPGNTHVWTGCPGISCRIIDFR